MAAVVGGDFIEGTYNHPVLGSGVIYFKANEDATVDFGGVRTNDDANSIDGAGRTIKQMNRVRWSFENTVAWDQNVNLDLQKLTALAGDPQEADWTFQHISGAIYRGTGGPVGDLQGAANQSTFQLKVAGGGILKKIA